MPNRVIKESVTRNEKINKLNWFEEVVFYRLMVAADDYGCFDGRIAIIKSELFPLKENVTKKAIEDAISKLTSVGLLQVYEANGKPYLHFPSWEKHQRVRNAQSKYPLPPDKSTLTATRGQLTDNCQQLAVNCRQKDEKENCIKEKEESSFKEDIYISALKDGFKENKRFIKPTVEQIQEYCNKRHNGINAQSFYDFYESKGWLVGKTPMKNWEAAVRTWEQRHKAENPQRTASFDLDEFFDLATKRGQ